MAEPKTRSDTIFVHEFLAFVQQKLDVMDQLSLEQILVSSFTEDEIQEAKKILAQTAKTSVRLITRARDGRGKKDLQDIFKVFLETDPDDVPIYVARDLNKLPPVTFDHVDVTRLLKDIVLLRTDVTDLRTKLVNSEEKITELRTQLEELRKSNNIALLNTAESARNVNMQRGVTRCPTSTVSNVTRDTDAQVIDCPVAMTSIPGSSVTQPAKIEPSPAPRRNQQRKSYAQVSRQPNLQQPKPCSESRQKDLTGMKADKDGFTLVEKKRRPKPSRNQRGTASIAAATTLRAVEPTIQIYISRLDKDTSDEDITRFVRERCQCRIEEPFSMSLKRLESSRATNFKSYALQVPAKHKDTLLVPDFWPAGVVYRRYREAPPKKKTLT